MNRRGVALLISFLLICVVLFVQVGKRDNVSSAQEMAIENAKMQSPIPWSLVEDKPNGDFFTYNGHYVRVEEGSTFKTANVFTGHASRDGADLTLDYWGYTFDKKGEVVVSGQIPYTIKDYFRGTAEDSHLKYLPPELKVYTDKNAKKRHVSKIENGDVGIRFDETTDQALPWGRGVYTTRVENPSDH